MPRGRSAPDFGYDEAVQLDPSSDLADCIEQLRLNIHERIRIVDALIAASLGPPIGSVREETESVPALVSQVLPMLLQAMGSSSNTLLKLSDPPGLQTRDCFSISRSIVELAVNICYIVAKGPEAAERALRHARQKSVRDLTRESNIGAQRIKLGFAAAFDASSVPGLEEELNEFVSRTGREKGWVDENIDQRIEVAGQLSSTVLSGLHFARVMIYRHSSEVLHGTLFGTNYSFGLTQPVGAPASPSDLVGFLGGQMMMILMAVNLAHQAVTEAFDIRYGFKAAKKRSDELTRALGEIRMFRNNLDAPAD